jgi:hypothetical protein
MARGKATIRFRNGTRLEFGNACEFQHGCGDFVVLHLEDADGRSTELAFVERDIESTALTTAASCIGFKRRDKR